MDPECDDVRNFPPPADGLERRLHVAEADLQLAGANYYFEAGYLVKDDIDIFNTMGWRKVTPLGPGFWTFSLDTSLANGPSLDAWVPRGTLTASESAQVHDTGVGELEVASKVVDQGGGLHRYEYALMNFNFDRQLNGFSVPLEPGSTVSQVAFSDATDVASDDWTPTVGATSVSWNAPAGLGADWARCGEWRSPLTKRPRSSASCCCPSRRAHPTRSRWQRRYRSPSPVSRCSCSLVHRRC
jgi:hypothetical protein